MPKPEPDIPSPSPGTCLNCGTQLRGHWCHECGQREFNFRQSLWRMGVETLEHLVHFDGRFSRNVVALLFSPGRLTQAFLAGKRAAQVPPLRFYLFVSLIFFLTLPLRTEIYDQPSPTQELTQTDGETTPTPAIKNPILRDFFEGIQIGVADKEQEIEQEEELSHDDRRKKRNNDKIADRFSRPEDFVAFLFKHAPNVIFFSLPVLAFMTCVLFRRAKYSYLEHLVVALHLGSFYFSFSLVEEGWSLLFGLLSPLSSTVVSAVAGIYSIIFLPWMFHRVFKNSLWGTLWRTTLFILAATFFFVTTLFGVTTFYAIG